MIAFIALGSNLGDRLENLRAALEAIEARGARVVAFSRVYETAPIGPPQPDYLNAVAQIETGLSPRDLLEMLKTAEVSLGRHHRERWGPREIDLDILLYEDLSLSENGLEIPHPHLTERSFVLVPLLDLCPDAALPSGRALSEYLNDSGEDLRPFSHGLERTV